MEYRIEMAMSSYFSKYGKSCKNELITALSPKSKTKTAEANFRNKLKNKTRSFTCDEINIICDITEVTADYFVGRDNI